MVAAPPPETAAGNRTRRIGQPIHPLDGHQCVCHYAFMDEVTPLEQAQANVKEAERQVEKAKKDLAQGIISEDRLRQLEKLRDIAAEDLRRVIKES